METISAIDFFKLCKLLKVYPTVVSLENVKSVVLQNPEFWAEKGHSSKKDEKTKNDNNFEFGDFVRAFKVS